MSPPITITVAIALASTLLFVGVDARACDGAEKQPRFVTKGPLPANAGGVIWWNGRWPTAIRCGPKASGCTVRLPDPDGWRIERLDDVNAEAARGDAGTGDAGTGEAGAGKAAGDAESEGATVVPHRVEPILTREFPNGSVRTTAFLLAPEKGFEPGRRYRFHAPERTRPIVLTVSTAELKSADATLTVGDQAAGPIRGNRMVGHEQGQARDLRLQLPPSAKRFEGALGYRTTVNGKPWRENLEPCEYARPDHALAGRGRDRLTMRCEGWHDDDDPFRPNQPSLVHMQAVLPGTDVTFDAKAKVAFDCPDQPGASKGSSSPAPGGCSGCAWQPPRRDRWGWLAASLLLLCLSRLGRQFGSRPRDRL
jgi:hypothetical protein